MHTMHLTACWIYIETTESAGPASRTPESSQNSTGTLGHWHARARRQEGDRRPPHASRTHTRRAVRGRRLSTYVLRACVRESSDVRDGDGDDGSDGGLLLHM